MRDLTFLKMTRAGFPVLKSAQPPTQGAARGSQVQCLSSSVISRGVGGSGHGYNSLLKPAGGSA